MADLGLKSPSPFLEMKNTVGQISNILYLFYMLVFLVFCVAVQKNKKSVMSFHEPAMPVVIFRNVDW